MKFETKLPIGFMLGHSQDDFTGVSVVLCAVDAVGGVDVRGGAPGTHETDCLHNEKMMDKVNGIALCGGSAYGLAAIAGVMEYLKETGNGFHVADKIVPIVPGAVIYDLNDKEYHYPTPKFGYEAAKNASFEARFGKVGVGTGATIGKILGLERSCPSGLGIASLRVGEATVCAVVCVNAFGDILSDKDGCIIAGAKDENGVFIGTEEFIFKNACLKSPSVGTNTTIGCVLTDAKLTKTQANKLAAISHNGLAKTISPVHTDFDGDTLFALSSGKFEADFLALEVAAQKVVARAVNNAVLSV